MAHDERAGADTLASASDGHLTREAARGSRDALEGLYLRYADLVYGAAYRATGSRTDADDVLQDVFVGLPRALQRYQDQGSFAAWLRTVATRTALMKVRAATRRPWESLPDTVPDRGASPDRSVDRLALERALETMPEPLRTVFLLKEVDGYSHREIAELLSIRAGACRVRLHRAWAYLDARFRREEGS